MGGIGNGEKLAINLLPSQSVFICGRFIKYNFLIFVIASIHIKHKLSFTEFLGFIVTATLTRSARIDSTA